MTTSRLTQLWHRHKLTCLRSLVLISGCLLAMSSGSGMSGYVYINALKEIFHLSQTQVEVANALCQLGLSAGFVPGLMLIKFSTSRTLLCGTVISGAGYFLLYSACLQTEFYINHPAFICIYLLLIGIGSAFTIFLPIVTCFQSFGPEHRGKVIGLTIASLAAGRTLFATLYAAIFAKGHVDDPVHHDLAGYILTAVAVVVSSGAFAMVFLRIYPPGCEQENGYEEILSSTDFQLKDDATQSDITAVPPDNDVVENAGRGGLALLRHKFFHLFFWQVVLCGAAQVTFFDNQAVYLAAFRLDRFIAIASVLSVALQILMKFSSGFISDCLLVRFRIPRTIILLVAHTLQTVLFATAIFCAENLVFFIVLLLVVSTAYSSLASQLPTIMSEHYGFKQLAIDAGCVWFSTALLTLGVEAIFGVIYAREITVPGEKQCYGLHCFTWSFVFLTALSLTGTILNACCFYLDWNKLRERRN